MISEIWQYVNSELYFISWTQKRKDELKDGVGKITTTTLWIGMRGGVQAWLSLANNVREQFRHLALAAWPENRHDGAQIEENNDGFFISATDTY